MNKNIFAFIISSIAGLSTLIGFLIVYLKKDSINIISKALGFASGVMLSISIIDLLPSSISLIFSIYSIIYSLFLVLIAFVIGIILSNIIDIKVDKHSSDKLKLYKLGIITMIAIIMHNIPEGIVTFITTTNNTKLGISLAVAITLHNIPEGISISVPIYYSTGNKIKAFIYTLLSGLSEPFGAILAYVFFARYINNTLLGIIYSIIASMMINISLNELYKEAYNYNKKNTIIYFILGIIIMILNHLLFN